MHKSNGDVVVVGTISLLYPTSHWTELRRFAEGDQLDPKGLFRLADDTWDAWPYAEKGSPTKAETYRYRFGILNSFLKLYVKLYCYEELIGRGGPLRSGAPFFPYRLSPADREILRLGLTSIDDLVIDSNFRSVWSSLLRVKMDSKSTSSQQLIVGNSPPLLPSSAVILQSQTLPFWRFLSFRFGAPSRVLPVNPHRKKTPAVIGSDESKMIPPAIIRQLANILALHRDGVTILNRFHHLRLCILLLHIVLGRRIEELLTSPRGKGPDGPLERFPCRHEDGEAADALWFKFFPSKDGPEEYVHISSEFESLATYCVRELIRYSDEVREFAQLAERNLLILVSTWNMTGGYFMHSPPVPIGSLDFTRKGGVQTGTQKRRQMGGKTTALSYGALRTWLNGKERAGDIGERWKGFMEAWHVTSDGLADSAIYKLDTHQARHTRQSVLSRDSRVSEVTKQRDLNHRDPNMQMAYQHVLEEKNEELLSIITDAPLNGYDLQFLKGVLGIHIGGPHDKDKEPVSNYEMGLVTLITPRLRKLMEANPDFFEKNRVDFGFCGESEPCETFTRSEQAAKKNKGRGNTAPQNKTMSKDQVAANAAEKVDDSMHVSLTRSPATVEDVVKSLRGRLELLEKGDE